MTLKDSTVVERWLGWMDFISLDCLWSLMVLFLVSVSSFDVERMKTGRMERRSFGGRNVVFRTIR